MQVLCPFGLGSEIRGGGRLCYCSEFLRWPNNRKLIGKCSAASTRPKNLCSW